MDYSDKTKQELLAEINFLKKKEKVISNVLSFTNEIIYHISFTEKGEKKIEYVSPHVERVMGITTQKYIDDNYKNKIIEYFHPDDLQRIIKESEKVISSGGEHTLKYRFFNKKLDKYIWIEENLVSVFGKNKKRQAIFGTAKDITEKVDKDKQLSFILENVEECIYNVQFTANGKVLNFVSPVIKKLTGLTEKEFEKEGKSGKLIKRIHPDDIKLINKNIEEGLYKKKLKSIHSTFRLKPKGEKKYLWIEETLNAIYDQKGNLKETTTVLRDITKQKVVEEHLKENEEKYRTIFTKNLAGVFITENNVLKDCNNSFAKIFGYKSRVELIGKKATNLYFSKKDRDKYVKELKQKGSLTNYMNRQKSKDGKEIWILTNVTLVENNRIEGTLVDITEQVHIERRLKENEKNYKELTENSPFGIFVHINGKIIYANKEAYKIWGINGSSPKAQNLNINQFILPENKKEADERTKKASLGKEVPFKEFQIKKGFSDELIYVEIKPIAFNFKGEKAIQVVFKDITVEKELSKEKLRAQVAEESNKILQKEIIERKLVEKKLIENQKYTSSIINSSLDIICASDKNGKIIEFNSAAEQAFGYKEEEIVDRGVQLIYAHKKDYLEVSKELKNKGLYNGEVLNKRKNGEEFISFLSASVLYDEEGKQIGTMGVSRDISERKKQEQQLIESEEKYRDLFENATDLIQSLSIDGTILYVNNSWKNALGYTDKDLENKNIFDIIHPNCQEKCQLLFKDILKSKEGETNKVNYELRTKEGKKLNVEGSVSLKYKNGKPESTRAILRDVTEEMHDKTKQEVYNNIAKIITEETNSDEIYEGIRQELGKVMHTENFIISYAVDKKTVSFPFYYEEEKGRIFKPPRHKGDGINEFLLKQKTPKLLRRKELDEIINKGKYSLSGKKSKAFIGVPLKIKNKTIGVLTVQSYRNENEYDENSVQILSFISGALALAVQRIADEHKIFEQSSRLKSIIENSTHLFWTYNKEKGLTSFNNNFVKYIEQAYNKKVELKHNEGEKLRYSPLETFGFWDKKYDKAFEGKPQYFISTKLNHKGNEIVKEVYLNPIYNNDGSISEVSGIAHDITEKTLSEQQLKESLKEKEVLLKEVHHRVKNNLQVISSILNLQSSYVKDENTLNLLKESQNRIKSMAFIHESLYQTTDFSKINFSEYIISLSKNLVHSYGVYDNLVDLNLSVGNVSLDLDLSIPCGLIVNELVSNSLKYAFPKNKKGTIKIELFEKNNTVKLIVQDNGVGLPKEINYKDTDSLGLQLVMTLVEQINGTIDLDNTKGAKYLIVFKK